MQTIEPWQLRTMHAIARSLDIDSENLHSLAACLTGRESLKALSFAEAAGVIADLKARQKQAGAAAAPKLTAKKPPATPGGMTHEQQGKAWALMYELEKHDPPTGGATVGGRLCGIIKKELGIDAGLQTPFMWVDMRRGMKLIDALGRYVKQAKKRTGQKEGSGDG